jgi:hypothetical protein
MILSLWDLECNKLFKMWLIGNIVKSSSHLYKMDQYIHVHIITINKSKTFCEIDLKNTSVSKWLNFNQFIALPDNNLSVDSFLSKCNKNGYRNRLHFCNCEYVKQNEST